MFNLMVECMEDSDYIVQDIIDDIEEDDDGFMEFESVEELEEYLRNQ